MQGREEKERISRESMHELPVQGSVINSSPSRSSPLAECTRFWPKYTFPSRLR